MSLDKKEEMLQQELAAQIEQYTGTDGIWATSIPSLHFIKASQETDPIHSLYEPALCIVAQGTKLVLLGKESYVYDPSCYLVASVQLPVSGQVIQATPENPYLCMQLDFQGSQIIELIQEVDISRSVPSSKRALYVSKTNTSLLEAAVRLVKLLDTPQDIPVIAPLIIREILYRVLLGEQGHSIKQFAVTGSHADCIAQAIEMIKRDFAKPLRVETLAAAVNMSTSSLHYHFKEVTAMSPLQYQKKLRLQEARRILFSGGTEAANAGFLVGYESPSQFSREYSRMFGLPPISDIKQFRDTLRVGSN
ncbi:AraC family transcriptional regulator [Paenibacillus sabinae]|uniref:AraC family transcriptional regulator n=1 Tax=Paenibacillus sabinae T27 TaxID=1268072 RepID=X4ZUN0_9BACL|nr:AraC family transcriptional regulator [Paenibacillus sabinae]AHV96038.1 AraC family transcriptional regulator [Paenibacillus sabinae T27]